MLLMPCKCDQFSFYKICTKSVAMMKEKRKHRVCYKKRNKSYLNERNNQKRKSLLKTSLLGEQRVILKIEKYKNACQSALYFSIFFLFAITMCAAMLRKIFTYNFHSIKTAILCNNNEVGVCIQYCIVLLKRQCNAMQTVHFDCEFRHKVCNYMNYRIKQRILHTATHTHSGCYLQTDDKGMLCT